MCVDWLVCGLPCGMCVALVLLDGVVCVVWLWLVVVVVGGWVGWWLVKGCGLNLVGGIPL